MLASFIDLQAEKILEDLCRVAMSREDTTQMEMELAKMEGTTTATTTASGTPAHRPLEEGDKLFLLECKITLSKLRFKDTH